MELELAYNEETQEWEEKTEPFITIECETEEDFEFIGTAVAFYKKHLEGQEKPRTNADRIRAMSDEELADVVVCPHTSNWDLCTNDCKKCRLDWLKQPAEEEAQQDCTYNKNGHCIGQKLMPECDPKSCDRKNH